jgi:hypothetical protein
VTDSLLDRVREEAAAVAGVATFVRVDEAAIAAYASTLPIAQARAPELDAATHYLADPEGTLMFLVTLDAINFGSGYFPRLRKRGSLSGYFTVAAGLKDEYDRHGPLAAATLAGLSIEDCARIFDQSLREDAVAELMGLFAQALNDLGRYVEQEFDGSFRTLVESAEGSVARLAAVLVGMPFYRDVALYHEREVPFYKRAQLTAADLSIADVAQFTDLDRLTIFADNLVPHVLRMDGVLHYEPGLLGRINREELIVPGSDEEVEIRACALHAVELIARRLREQGEPVTAMQLDYVLWNRGQESKYKAVPRHRARTVYY